MQLFDPKQKYAVVERRLPHWSQAGTVTFITWRTWDSMPEPVVLEWQAERAEWLRRHGIDPARPDWEDRARTLDDDLVRELQ